MRVFGSKLATVSTSTCSSWEVRWIKAKGVRMILYANGSLWTLPPLHLIPIILTEHFTTFSIATHLDKSQKSSFRIVNFFNPLTGIDTIVRTSFYYFPVNNIFMKLTRLQMDGDQHVGRPIFRNFKISNVKYFEYCFQFSILLFLNWFFHFFLYLNYSNTQSIW